MTVPADSNSRNSNSMSLPSLATGVYRPPSSSLSRSQGAISQPQPGGSSALANGYHHQPSPSSQSMGSSQHGQSRPLYDTYRRPSQNSTPASTQAPAPYPRVPSSMASSAPVSPNQGPQPPSSSAPPSAGQSHAMSLPPIYSSHAYPATRLPSVQYSQQPTPHFPRSQPTGTTALPHAQGASSPIGEQRPATHDGSTPRPSTSQSSAHPPHRPESTGSQNHPKSPVAAGPHGSGQQPGPHSLPGFSNDSQKHVLHQPHRIMHSYLPPMPPKDTPSPQTSAQQRWHPTQYEPTANRPQGVHKPHSQDDQPHRHHHHHHHHYPQPPPAPPAHRHYHHPPSIGAELPEAERQSEANTYLHRHQPQQDRGFHAGPSHMHAQQPPPNSASPTEGAPANTNARPGQPMPYFSMPAPLQNTPESTSNHKRKRSDADLAKPHPRPHHQADAPRSTKPQPPSSFMPAKSLGTGTPQDVADGPQPPSHKQAKVAHPEATSAPGPPPPSYSQMPPYEMWGAQNQTGQGHQQPQQQPRPAAVPVTSATRPVPNQPPPLHIHPQIAPQPSYGQPSPVGSAAPKPPLAQPDVSRAKILQSAFAPSILEVRSKLKNVDKRLDELKFLGRCVWDPTSSKPVLPSQLQSEGYCEVYVDTRWFKGLPWQVCEPGESPNFADSKDGQAADSPGTEDYRDWSFHGLEPVRRRSLWGTDCYTDDSDPLLAAIHCGFVRTSEFATNPDTRSDAVLKIIVRTHPKLINFQGCARAGIRSRSWGNSHDGVSFTVDSVRVLEGAEAQGACSKRARKQKIVPFKPTLTSPKCGRITLGKEVAFGALDGCDTFKWDNDGKLWCVMSITAGTPVIF